MVQDKEKYMEENIDKKASHGHNIDDVIHHALCAGVVSIHGEP